MPAGLLLRHQLVLLPGYKQQRDWSEAGTAGWLHVQAIVVVIIWWSWATDSTYEQHRLISSMERHTKDSCNGDVEGAQVGLTKEAVVHSGNEAGYDQDDDACIVQPPDSLQQQLLSMLLHRVAPLYTCHSSLAASWPEMERVLEQIPACHVNAWGRQYSSARQLRQAQVQASMLH